MKRLIWLLLIINVVLFAYFNLDYVSPNKPVVKLPELNSEKISLLTQQQLDLLPKKAGVMTEPITMIANTPSCYEWGVFSSTRIAAAQTGAAKLMLKPTTKEQSDQDAQIRKLFWIYILPVKSAQNAQAKAAQLQSLGVQDLFVMQEPKWRNAISFGVFEDEKLAIKLMDELKAKGVSDVVKTLRDQGKGHFNLLFKHLEELQAAEIKKLKSDFPEADLKQVTCN